MINQQSQAGRRAGLVLACLAAATLAACAAGPPVETTVGYRYVEAARSVHSYRVEFLRMPEFLKPMLRDEVSRVLADKGIEYTEGEAHAVMLMSFDNEPLPSAVAERRTETGERSEEIVAARFFARVRLDMTDSVSGERIWSASLGRLHYVTEGAYMHEAPARKAVRDALAAIFTDFPNRKNAPDTKE